MALAHGETVGIRRLERAFPVFCVEKYPGKDGERRMAKWKWRDEYCNKCGNQLNSWDGCPAVQGPCVQVPML